MRRQVQKWLTFLVLIGMPGWAACSPQTPGVSLPAETEPQSTDETHWQETCLQGTIQALNMEIGQYTTWLQNGDEGQAAIYQQALDYLQAELQTYENLSPAEYRVGSAWRYIPGVTIGAYGRSALPPAPERITLDDAWLDGDGLLYYDGMSRSGPFYTLVPTDSRSSLQLNIHYRVEIQPIMPASYPFPSYYVCLYASEILK